jgi:hypothetical protein
MCHVAVGIMGLNATFNNIIICVTENHLDGKILDNYIIIDELSGVVVIVW